MHNAIKLKNNDILKTTHKIYEIYELPRKRK